MILMKIKPFRAFLFIMLSVFALIFLKGVLHPAGDLHIRMVVELTSAAFLRSIYLSLFVL
jgi:hypothetical protein